MRSILHSLVWGAAVYYATGTRAALSPVGPDEEAAAIEVKSKNPNLNLHTSSWPEWDSHVERWSSYHMPTFSLVFKPETEKELSEGMRQLSSNKVRFLATKGGGHGNVPTLGGYRDVVQINMQNFQHVVVDPADHTVTLGGGAQMRHIIPALHKAGREMTVGSFPCVGTHGVLLGGGMGRLQGKYGLMIDAVIKFKVALWNGTVVEASRDRNQDLFWALRGAGHSFGVVLETKFRTWPDQGGMHYNADMVFTEDSIEGVVRLFGEIVEEGMDPGLFLMAGFVADPSNARPLFVLNLVFAHDEEKGRTATARFASDASRGITRVSLQESVIDFAELGSGASLPGVCDPMLNNTLFTASSPSMFQPAKMREAYDSFAALLSQHPAANRSILLLEAVSGATIASLPDESSAYAHRGRLNTNAIIQVTWDGEEADATGSAAVAWGRGVRDALARPDVSGYDRLYAYVNYAHDDEPLGALYGYDRWRQEKLTRLKKEFDPHGFFNAYRAIPLDMAGWEHEGSFPGDSPGKDEL